MKQIFTPTKGSRRSTFLFALFFLSIPLAKSQIYVDQTAVGGNNGTSWDDAYTELATALDNYNAGDEIWVAAGTYTPQEPAAWANDPIDKKTFYIYQDVELYGGFDGTETMVSQRDPVANITVLSGDLNGDDVDDDFETNREDNVINVLFLTTAISPATIIDGFTVANGHADGDDSVPFNQRAGGLWTLGSPMVINCYFTQNYALTFGGGMYLRGEESDEAVVEDCIFEGNRSGASGAGMSIATFGSAGIIQVSGCQFIGNTADSNGGGLYITTSSAEISSCRFEENSAANGGGFWRFSTGSTDGSLTIQTCDFINNEAIVTEQDSFPDAGGLGFSHSTITPSQQDTIRVIDCLIQGNTTEGSTGGLYYSHSAGVDNHLQVDNCEFIGNSDSSGISVGGMAVAEGGENTSVLVRNTLFDGNTGPLVQGFGVSAVSGIDPPGQRHIELVNCLFTNHNNTEPETAVVITNREFTLTNCTFSENQSVLLGTAGNNGKITIRNNIFQTVDSVSYTAIGDSINNFPILSLGGNLISDDAMDTWLTSTDQSDTDPMFEAGTYQLSQNSPAVDAGVLLDDPTITDFSGNARIQGSCIDIGANESPYDAGVGECLEFTNTREVLAAPSTLRVFPNPTSDLAHFAIENKWTGELELRIVNTLGQVVHTATFEKHGEEVVLEFDAGNLPKGLYRVLVSDDKVLAVGSFLRL